MYKYACVYLECPITGRILGVSRKDDWNDFGLPGGKIEKGEDYMSAAARELKEATGIVVDPRALSHVAYEDGETVTVECSLLWIMGADQQLKKPGERGIVDWVNREQLCGGSFSDYNKALFKKLGKPVEDIDVGY